MQSYKFKLHAKAKKDGYLDDKITRHLRLYNQIVELGDRFYKRYKRILRSQTLNKYIQMKKSDTSWDYILKGLNAWAVQETIKRRDEAFSRFFKYLRKKQENPYIETKDSPPQKHRVHGIGSFKLNKGNGWKLLEDGVLTGYLWPMFGRKREVHTYKFFGNREILGEVKNCVFKRDGCGDLWCIVTTTNTAFRHIPKTGKIGGFDYSQEHFFVGDDGRFWDIPKALESHFAELSKVTRKMHKAQKGSSNSKRWKAKRARLYRKITNQRRAFHYELAWRMCREYDVLCFESNDYADMYDSKRVIDGHRVSKKQRYTLKSFAPSSFLTIVKEVVQKAGKTVFFANRHFASSQICSNCGHVNKAVKDLRIRQWTCLKCGTKHDRDVNAAKNLVKEFKRTVGGAPSIETETKKESEKTTYWERIRKSASLKRAAGSVEKSTCPRKPQVPGADKSDGTEPKCPELYTDASTVSTKEGEHGTVRKDRCWTIVEKPPG